MSVCVMFATLQMNSGEGMHLEIYLLHHSAPEHVQQHALCQLAVWVILKLLASKHHAGLQAKESEW